MADKRPGERRVSGARLTFDPDVWNDEVGRFSPGARAHQVAVVARRRIEVPGAVVTLRACVQEAAEDGTRLGGCAKVYVPLDGEPSRAEFGFVFAFRTRHQDGVVTVLLVAFGERHPVRGRSVYERAHLRLRGRYPDEE